MSLIVALVEINGQANNTTICNPAGEIMKNCVLVKFRRIPALLVALGMVLLLFSGCARKTLFDFAGQGRTNYETAAAPPASVMAETATLDTALKMSSKPISPKSTAETRPERMIHHDGYLRLRTPRPDELVDKATEVVEAVGGYVERLDGGSAVFRVPVGEFQSVFDKILTLGEVLDQSITTEDITDAYMDVDLRLNIARSTLERLTELLAKAKGEKEKIRILREIQRIRTEIETLAAQKELLIAKANFSTINLHIEVRSLKRVGAVENITAFQWIHDLSPFDELVARRGRSLELDVPEGMVVLEGKEVWLAESADGAFMRASRHELQPVGDTDFWLQAVRQRLGPDYGEVTVVEKGNFKLLRLENRSETPYIYLVGLHVDQSHNLQVVEIYYPAPSLEKRYQEQVFSSVAGGAL
jgi:hypothetical protein